MEQLLERLKKIKASVQKLQNENQTLQRSLEQKEKETARLKQLLEIQNNSIKQLEEKVKIKRIADGVSGEEENGSNRDLKFKVNEMIREIDKIITLIHQ